jgi:probable phosphoglycerate mutase
VADILDIPLPTIYLARHGETEWSRSGRHTGRTDIPLTERGLRDAVLLGKRLKSLTFAHVWSSPRERARHTAALAGYDSTEIVPELAEWDYGDVEGLTSVDYRKSRPGWNLFRDGSPGGESLAEIGARVDRVIARLRSTSGDILLFSHGHLLRVLAARWIGLEAAGAAHFYLSTAAFCALGYEHSLDRPAVRLWNDTSHLLPTPE